MGRLHSWLGAARRSRRIRVGAAVIVVLALGAAGTAIFATQSPTPGPLSPTASTRAVALGDSVPYGHGLHNPYRTPQVGLPEGWVSQGPSALAYPSRVASALGLTMSVRTTNCDLTGDQLAVSGAVADAADNTSPDGQCLHPAGPARNLTEEITAADLAQHPARLVLLQDGADDIDFASCLEYELARVPVLGTNLDIGTECAVNGAVTPALAAKLADVRASLARAVETVARHATQVVVLDYYQPIPSPAQISGSASAPALHSNLVCAGLKDDPGPTYAAAQVVLRALNTAIAGAVTDARSAHVKNVVLVHLASSFDGHGLCTADPWVFSGEPVPDTTLAAVAEHVLAAKACNETKVLHGALSCASLAAQARLAEQELTAYVWRAVHPTVTGQAAIATTVLQQLHGRVA
jgi:hypothetical protein